MPHLRERNGVVDIAKLNIVETDVVLAEFPPPFAMEWMATEDDFSTR